MDIEISLVLETPVSDNLAFRLTLKFRNYKLHRKVSISKLSIIPICYDSSLFRSHDIRHVQNA